MWFALVVDAAMLVVELAHSHSAAQGLLHDAFGLFAVCSGPGAAATQALAANVVVAWTLYAFREGDANMRSVWLCSRNDALALHPSLHARPGVLVRWTERPDS